MEGFLTSQNKLEVVKRECQRLKNQDGMMQYDHCVSIIKMICPESSNVKVEKLLFDADEEGLGLIDVDALNKMAKYLLSEENNTHEHGEDDELPDEEQAHERNYGLLEEVDKLIKDGKKIDQELWNELVEKHKVNIGQ